MIRQTSLPESLGTGSLVPAILTFCLPFAIHIDRDAWEILMIWLLTGLLVLGLVVTSLRASAWLLYRGSYNAD